MCTTLLQRKMKSMCFSLFNKKYITFSLTTTIKVKTILPTLTNDIKKFLYIVINNTLPCDTFSTQIQHNTILCFTCHTTTDENIYAQHLNNVASVYVLSGSVWNIKIYIKKSMIGLVSVLKIFFLVFNSRHSETNTDGVNTRLIFSNKNP